jgi:hypothetical protein
MRIFPGKDDRGIVVFWLLPSLSYGTRLAASFALVLVGLAAQMVTGTVLPGVLALAAGNLLLLVKGYDNRVDLKSFDPAIEWERVEVEKLQELADLNRKIRRWDRSALDVSNPLGLVAFVVVAGGLGVVALLFPGERRILAVDGLVLLIPHWLTGIRRILVKPTLLVRVQTIQAVLDDATRRLARHHVQLLMLLRGGEIRIPDDVKFKVELSDRHEDFLGLYGQVVINDVQGTSYPYFYVVLVAKDGFGLRETFDGYRPPEKITKEFKTQDQVEVMVIRQHTTKKSGYHTKPAAAARVFREGLAMAQRAAVGVPA